MKRGGSLSLLVICLLLQFAAHPVFAKVGSTAKSDSKNVLFIAVDDLNDWVGYMNTQGIKKPKVYTPNIDRLARRGMAFTRAYTTAPVCGPSRAAILTGVRPTTSGVYTNHHNHNKIMPDIITLPEHFSANGYDVIGAGKLHHPPYEDVSRWDDFITSWVETQKFSAPPNRIRFEGIDVAYDFCSEDQMHDYEVADYAIDYLSQAHKKPFFLACGIYNPHAPWWVPKKYFDMYPLDEIQLPEVKEDDLDDLPPAAKRIAYSVLTNHEKVEGEKKWHLFVQAYMACITFADAQIGRILDALDASEYAENTIVCLWSDHGWHLGEKQHWHKSTLWERACHVPFIWVVPGMTKQGSVCDAIVELQSIYPTLSSLCGLEKPMTVEGHDLTPLLKNSGSEWRHGAVTVLSNNKTIRTKDWRYITYGEGQEELYNHTNDPNEWNNLANDPQYDSIKKELKAQLPKAVESAPLDWGLLRPQRIKRLKNKLSDKKCVAQSENTFMFLSGNWQKEDAITYTSVSNQSRADWYHLFKTKHTRNYKVEIKIDGKHINKHSNSQEIILITSDKKEKIDIDTSKFNNKWQEIGVFNFKGDMQKVLELSGKGQLVSPELRITKVKSTD